MIKIRLDRRGTKKKAFYKIVATNENQKKGGSSLDTLGFWHPFKKKFEINKEKFDSWIKKGARPSEAIKKLCENY